MENTQRLHHKTPVFIADVGGTNVRLAVDYGMGKEPQSTEYKVQEYESFEDIVVDFIAKTGVQPELFAIGAAGCVDEMNETVKGSNSSWQISTAQLKKTFPTIRQVRLVNDFYLMALGASRLKPEEITVLQGNHPLDFDKMNVAVMGAGTGWGTSFSLRQPHSAPSVHTSESGHICLPKLTFEDPKLAKAHRIVCRALKKRFEEAAQKGWDTKRPAGVVVENIISGTGIRNVYTALTTDKIPLNREEMIGSEVIEAKAKAGDPIAKQTFQIFNAYVGAHIGNVACAMNLNGVVLTASFFANPWTVEQMANDPLFHKHLTTNRAGMTTPLKNLIVVASKRKGLPELGSLQLAERLRDVDEEMKAKSARLQERSGDSDQLLSKLLAFSRLPELANNAYAQREIIEMIHLAQDLKPTHPVPVKHDDMLSRGYWQQEGRDPR